MGAQKASLPAWKTFSMALLAGAYVGFGGFLAMSIGANCPELAATNPGLQKIIFGAFGLPLGLTMVVVCGEQCLLLLWGCPGGSLWRWSVGSAAGSFSRADPGAQQRCSLVSIACQTLLGAPGAHHGCLSVVSAACSFVELPLAAHRGGDALKPWFSTKERAPWL